MLDEYFKKRQEFIIGQITNLSLTEQEYGPRIVVEITPIGETTPTLLFFSASTHRRSKWQRWLSMMRKLNPNINSANDLIKQIVKLELIEETYNVEGNSQISEFWVPRKIYTSEAEALADSDFVPAGERLGLRPTETKAALPPEIVMAAKALYANLHDVNAFRIVAGQSWPQYNVEELIAAATS